MEFNLMELLSQLMPIIGMALTAAVVYAATQVKKLVAATETKVDDAVLKSVEDGLRKVLGENAVK